MPIVLIIVSGAASASSVAAAIAAHAQASPSETVERRLGVVGCASYGKSEAMRQLIAASFDGMEPYSVADLMRETRRPDPFFDEHVRLIDATRARFMREPTPKEALEWIGRYECVDHCGAILKAKGQVCPRCARTRAKRHNYHQRKWKK